MHGISNGGMEVGQWDLVNAMIHMTNRRWADSRTGFDSRRNDSQWIHCDEEHDGNGLQRRNDVEYVAGAIGG